MSYGNYPNLSLVRRILVVKMRHHGDVLLTSPVFTNLKKYLQNVEIDALLYQETLPMLEGHPAISEFLLYDRSWKKLNIFKRMGRELMLLKRIRKKKYDLVLNLTEGDRGAIAALAAGSRYRVGFDPQGKGFKGKKNVYSHLVKHCHQPRHTVEKQLDALRRLGIFPLENERELLFYVPEDAKEKMRKRLKEQEIDLRRAVVIHPVSRWRFKCLPARTIIDLIRKLQREGWHPVLSGSADPQEMNDLAGICEQTSACSFAGQMSLKELGALLSLSACLICVDSVPLHMASALKTPVVAFFGPTSEKNWGPWRHPRGVVVSKSLPCRPCFMDGCGGSKVSDCLTTLEVEEIYSAFKNVVEAEELASTTVVP
ncbi:MAG: putative lipopolysaccharide heptosyltransferase III [Anaerolineae bacterium]